MAVDNLRPSSGPSWGREPNAHLRLTNADRDAAAEVLKDAYARGQLDGDEFDERLGLAMRAKVPADLAPLTADLTPVPRAPGRAPSAAPTGPRPAPRGEERLLAAGGHVSGYFLSALGPLLVLLIGGRNSEFVRRHAMEALNYQLTFLIASIVCGLLFFLVIPILVLVVLAMAWVFLPGIAGLVALAGGRWRYPFTWRPVKDA